VVFTGRRIGTIILAGLRLSAGLREGLLMLQGLRFALRVLTRNRAFSLGAVFSLSLGIGVATTVFNATMTALVNPLPVPDSDQMVTAFNYDPVVGKYLSSSYPDYLDLSQSVKSLEGLSAYVRLPLNVQLPSGTLRLPGEGVSTNYFSMLGIRLTAGRDFQQGDTEDQLTVILSYQLWTTHFGRSTGVLGKTIQINRQPFTVLGVAPKSYRGVDLSWSKPPEFWIPIQCTPAVLPSFGRHAVLQERSARFLLMIGRLRSSASPRQAQAELQVLTEALEGTYPTSNRNVSAVVLPASQSRFWPGHRESVTNLLTVLAVGAGLFLLLACANISSLLLGRAVSRTKEMSIRLSLGAYRSSLVNQLLLESAVLAFLGFGLALLLAYALNQLMTVFPSAFGLPLNLDLQLSLLTVGFCFGLSAVAILLTALVPALRASQVEVVRGLKESGGEASRSVSYRLRGTLVLAQVALATILLVGSGVVYRTLLVANSIDVGFASRNILCIEFESPSEQSPAGNPDQVLKRLLDNMQNVPGIRSATLAMNLPLASMRTMVRVSDGSDSSAPALDAHYNLVGPHFFKTLGAQLIAGRDFGEGEESARVRPAIVDQALAETLWPGQDPVGKLLTLRFGHNPPTPGTVVGLARNNRYNSIWDDPSPHIYLTPAPGESLRGNMILLTHGSADRLLTVVRKGWRRTAPDVPLYQIRTGDELKRTALTPYRVTGALLVILAAGSILLSFVGLYSVISMSVLRRSREIAIRIAVGALPRQAVAPAIRNLFALAIIGLVFGLVAGSYGTRWLSTAIANVRSSDMTVFGSVAVFLTAVLLAAALIPAIRAVRTDPARAFRLE
jgi:putative ABC transport system permease protein